MFLALHQREAIPVYSHRQRNIRVMQSQHIFNLTIIQSNIGQGEEEAE